MGETLKFKDVAGQHGLLKPIAHIGRTEGSGDKNYCLEVSLNLLMLFLVIIVWNMYEMFILYMIIIEIRVSNAKFAQKY